MWPFTDKSKPKANRDWLRQLFSRILRKSLRKPAQTKAASDDLKTLKQMLQEGITLPISLVKKTGNSDSSGLEFDLKGVKVWDDFFTVEEIEALWHDDPKLTEILSAGFGDDEMRSCITGKPPLTRRIMRNEMCVENWWATVQDHLNLIFQCCAKGMSLDDVVLMGNGDNATWISPNAQTNAHRKKPDLAGFQMQADLTGVIDNERASSDQDTLRSATPVEVRIENKIRALDPDSIFNRIPGDVKPSSKVFRDLLPPDGTKFLAGGDNVNSEARKVLKQIHGYMDRHEARYGYIVTDKELICFRRRGTGWGQLDIGPSIPHDVHVDRDNNTLNSKYVLFYLHWKVANDDSPTHGWRLKSFGKEEEKKNANILNKVARKLKSVRSKGAKKGKKKSKTMKRQK